MSTHILRCGAVATLAICALAQTRSAVNRDVAAMVAEVSTDRIAATMKKLESFGTRNIHSKSIADAQAWLAAELKSYSDALEVRFDKWNIKKQGRVMRDLELVNVVAVLHGTTQKDHQIVISGHYDSLVLVRKPDAVPGDVDGGTDWEASANAPLAPGVSDDASGVAATMELARLMSQRKWRKTLVFVLFSGEEEGLLGSRLMASKMKNENTIIDAVLNSDIIGNDVAGNGQTNTNTVRLFSAEPADSSSRALARFVREMAIRYVPGMKVDLVYRHDRFTRGGDHTPFTQSGYPAVRFTTAAENYANQHTVTDIFANASPEYTARVTRVKLAAAASIASAPLMPDVTRQLTGMAAIERGRTAPNLSRGKSGYDALLRWTYAAESDVAGFSVMVRSTSAPGWEHEIYVGNVRECTLKDFSIDDSVLGVKAIGNDGFESPVATYVAVERPNRPVEVVE